MEKYISKFDISNNVNKGTTKQLTVCPNCKKRYIINNINKYTYQKLLSYKCSKCNYTFYVGDIYNFKTGTKLNNINLKYNQKILDDVIWNDTYDII